LKLKAVFGEAHMSLKRVSCYSACQITLYIARRLHELADSNEPSKASITFVVSVRPFLQLRGTLLSADGFERKIYIGELCRNVSTRSSFG
jgi:hypothetical protein